jgi:hypothetical protein
VTWCARALRLHAENAAVLRGCQSPLCCRAPCSLASFDSAAQVIFLKDGSRLELLGVEDHQKLKAFVERQMN